MSLQQAPEQRPGKSLRTFCNILKLRPYNTSYHVVIPQRYMGHIPYHIPLQGPSSNWRYSQMCLGQVSTPALPHHGGLGHAVVQPVQILSVGSTLSSPYVINPTPHVGLWLEAVFYVFALQAADRRQSSWHLIITQRHQNARLPFQPFGLCCMFSTPPPC